MPDVPGRFLGTFNARNEFIYEYRCATCGRLFRDTAPSTYPPVVCAPCFTGTGTKAGRRDRRGAAHVQPSGKRRGKHESEAR